MLEHILVVFLILLPVSCNSLSATFCVKFILNFLTLE